LVFLVAHRRTSPSVGLFVLQLIVADQNATKRRHMIAWILILLLWGAFLLLILHDATKAEVNGSAVAQFVSRIHKRISRFSLSDPVPQDRPNAIEQAPAPAPKTEQAPAPAPKTEQAPAPAPKTEQAPAPAPKKRWWRKEARVPMKAVTADALELAIGESVRTAPGCEDFVGVLVQPKRPKSHLDPNWELRGVRYGNTDREMANQHLTTIVARLQQELRLVDHDEGDHPRSTKSIPSGGV
jgi:hypothetical protein